MAKAEFGTPKHLANQMKARGLQKLKWYCQVCEKQCRDDNGFKSHIRSESHITKIKSVTSSDIESYSQQFRSYFISNLRNFHGEKAINANRFYNQLIQQKDHIHLNSTKWSSLSQFIKQMAQEGIINAKVTGDDESLNSLDILYINNSGDEIMRKSLLKKHQSTEKTDEQLGMKLLQEQIKRGQQESKKESLAEEPGEETKKPEGPLKIQLSSTKVPKETKKPLKMNAFKISKPTSKPNPLRKNPLKPTK